MLKIRCRRRRYEKSPRPPKHSRTFCNFLTLYTTLPVMTPSSVLEGRWTVRAGCRRLAARSAAVGRAYRRRRSCVYVRVHACALAGIPWAGTSQGYFYLYYYKMCAALCVVVCVVVCVVGCVVNSPQSPMAREMRCAVGCVVGCAVGCAVGCVVTAACVRTAGCRQA